MSQAMINDTEARIRAVYAEHATAHGLNLSQILIRIGVNHDMFARAIDQMSTKPGIHVRQEAAQWLITRDDELAAVTLGGTKRHNLIIEPGY